MANRYNARRALRESTILQFTIPTYTERIATWSHFQSPPAFRCLLLEHRSGTKLFVPKSTEFSRSGRVFLNYFVGWRSILLRPCADFFRQRDASNRKRNMTFAEIGLHEILLKALADSGYTEPTPVQAQAIPAALEGRDLMVSSQTGSGKTAAFMLPALHRFAAQERSAFASEPGRTANQNRQSARSRGNDRPRFRAAQPKMLVLTPTRELAQQVTTATTAFMQIDEPLLVTELDADWRHAFNTAYHLSLIHI